MLHLDVLRLAVVRCPDDPELLEESTNTDFAVEVYVNEVEMTAAGAGLGMDPYDLLVPPGRLHPDRSPITVPIARCVCGVEGCGSTTIVIRRGDHGVVHWDWRRKVPMKRRVTFAGEQYEAEVRRAESDLSWETPERVAGRLIRVALSGRSLVEGLYLDQVGNDWRDAGRFCVSLLCDGPYQVFVDFAWGSLTPPELAEHIVSTLTAKPLTEWAGSWLSMIRNNSAPPPFAPATWSQHPLFS